MMAGQTQELFGRRSIRLKGYDYPLRGRCSQAGGYFVTIVTQLRETFFGKICDGEMNFKERGEYATDKKSIHCCNGLWADGDNHRLCVWTDRRHSHTDNITGQPHGNFNTGAIRRREHC